MKKTIPILLLSACLLFSACVGENAAPTMTEPASIMTEPAPETTGGDRLGEDDADEAAPTEALSADDTVVEQIELAEYTFDREITDYAEQYGLEFSLPEQKEIYNLAHSFGRAFLENRAGLDACRKTRYGTFTVNGRKTYGWLTGYSYDSYRRFLESVFLPRGVPEEMLLDEYHGELFSPDGERGSSGDSGEREIIFEDETTVVIRFAMTPNYAPETVDTRYTILTATADGWRVDLCSEPIIS